MKRTGNKQTLKPSCGLDNDFSAQSDPVFCFFYLFTQVEVDGPNRPTRLLVLVVLQDIWLPAQPTASQHEPTSLPRLEIARYTFYYPMEKKKVCFFIFCFLDKEQNIGINNGGLTLLSSKKWKITDTRCCCVN